MITRIEERLDEQRAGIDEAMLLEIRQAAQKILSGELVGFPTETVYGLGASVWNPAQIARIFTVKKRPQDNPLIAHVSNIDQLYELVEDVPEIAKKLIKAFWPGPPTLLFKKKLSDFKKYWGWKSFLIILVVTG